VSTRNESEVQRRSVEPPRRKGKSDPKQTSGVKIRGSPETDSEVCHKERRWFGKFRVSKALRAKNRANWQTRKPAYSTEKNRGRAETKSDNTSIREKSQEKTREERVREVSRKGTFLTERAQKEPSRCRKALRRPPRFPRNTLLRKRGASAEAIR